MADAGHGPYAVPHCHSAVGVPCAPKRETYGYFPTTWRRWPTEPSVAAPPAEAAPTPAEPQPTTTVPEVPETLPSPETTPLPGIPTQDPMKSPVMPPFDEGQLKPPFGDTTLPPPFDDAPPLPPSGATPTPPFDAGRALPTTPAPGGELPPSMPADDPFKDDPESNAIPSTPGPPSMTPPGDAPKSSRHRPSMPGTSERKAAVQASAEARLPRPVLGERELPSMALTLDDASEPPPQLKTLALERDAPAEPRRLEVPVEVTRPAALPLGGDRGNPLRVSSGASGPKTVVSTSSISAASPAAEAADRISWRRNPLRGD